MIKSINMFDFSALLTKGDALIIMPPFASLTMPSYAAHLLQACAKREGLQVRVLYSNLLLANTIGPPTYQEISHGLLNSALIGERFFSKAAYGPAAPTQQTEHAHAPYQRTYRGRAAHLTWKSFWILSEGAGDWAQAVADGLVPYYFPVIGCSTSFDQTSASIALLNAIKQRQPNTLTILGGANCEGEMALGVASLQAQVDYIFSGESEASFVQFLQSVKAGQLPSETIIRGDSVEQMDALPLPDYSEYFQQFAHFIGAALNKQPRLVYESSRGCWWGEKHHCTFCGLNGMTMALRQKSADKVIADLQVLTQAHPGIEVVMADNIMPHAYFQTLLPRLKEQELSINLFYEQKANLSLSKVRLIRDAGIISIQPGIESLSTPLLRRINKGTTAAQNIAVLRYARSVGLGVVWNLLYGFPGDALEFYEGMLGLLPLLHHLHPPKGFFQISLDRFSPYVRDPERYGISNIRPLHTYSEVFPSHANLEHLAYHFSADYRSASLENTALIEDIRQELGRWQTDWMETTQPQKPAPQLLVVGLSQKAFLLHDTRGLSGLPEHQIIDCDQAEAALAGGEKLSPTLLAWALAAKVGVLIDGAYTPLATSKPEVFDAFTSS